MNNHNSSENRAVIPPSNEHTKNNKTTGFIQSKSTNEKKNEREKEIEWNLDNVKCITIRLCLLCEFVCVMCYVYAWSYSQIRNKATTTAAATMKITKIIWIIECAHFPKRKVNEKRINGMMKKIQLRFNQILATRIGRDWIVQMITGYNLLLEIVGWVCVCEYNVYILSILCWYIVHGLKPLKSVRFVWFFMFLFWFLNTAFFVHLQREREKERPLNE